MKNVNRLRFAKAVQNNNLKKQENFCRQKNADPFTCYKEMKTAKDNLEEFMIPNLNWKEYRDKVYGCWSGKNIGGTLGGPLEGMKEINEISFYTQELHGVPEPNDDLDIQLLNLTAIEKHGLFNLTPRLLGEYFLDRVIGPWGEYSVARANIANGLYPPLSGSCCNERWKNSNGAWIRSELWACLFPGSPDEAIRFAWMDACIDHAGDGIYAEMFTAALESAAFVETDIRRLIDIALSKIPADSRIARSVKLACRCFDSGDDWKTARQAVVEDSSDLGWFQAPANIGFVIIGLLYGGGDFSCSVCRAVNCGDDADCTAATVGAVMGILQGRSKIPDQWLAPIGDTIQIIAVNRLGSPASIFPKTLMELTDRVMRQAKIASLQNPYNPSITGLPTMLEKSFQDNLSNPVEAEKILKQSFSELTFDLNFTQIAVEYGNGPEIEEGISKKIMIKTRMFLPVEGVIHFEWSLPDDWKITPSASSAGVKQCYDTALEFCLTAGKLAQPIQYAELKIFLRGRQPETVLKVPFLKKDTLLLFQDTLFPDFERLAVRNRACRECSAEEIMFS